MKSVDCFKLFIGAHGYTFAYGHGLSVAIATEVEMKAPRASVPSSVASSAAALIGRSQLPPGFATFHREILDMEKRTFPDTPTKEETNS